jgi:tetratricopeptide (TPR) repeat protein
VIDADEYLAPGALDALRAKLATYEGTTLRFVARCESNPAQWHHMVRAHRRAPEIRWRHRIHECLTHDDRHLAEGCEIIYGHSPAHALDPDRSIRILRAVLADDPQNARGLYYLGRDLGYRREFAEAIGLLQRRVALTPDPNPGETTDAWLLLARALWHSQRGPEAREACGVAIARNSHFREALFALAGMCYEPHRSRWMEMAKTADNSGVHFVRF